MSVELQESLEKVKKKSDDTYALLSNLTLSHEILKDKLDDAVYDLCTKISVAQHQETNGKVNSTFDDIKNELRSLRSHKDTIYTKIRLIEADLKEIKNALREILCDQYDTKKYVNDIEKKINPTVNQACESLSGKMVECKKELHSKIDNLIIPRDTVNIDQVKMQIASQTEAIRRDAATSTTANTNHNHRLNAIEKKLEGVFIQMKSHGIDK